MGGGKGGCYSYYNTHNLISGRGEAFGPESASTVLSHLQHTRVSVNDSQVNST